MKMYKIKKKTTKLDYVLEKIREEFDLSIEKQPFWHINLKHLHQKIKILCLYCVM